MILLDVDIPGKDAGEVALELEEVPALRGIPILFFTSLISRAEAGDREVVRGGKRFLAKTLNPAVLVATVDRILAAEAHVS
jgi:CheY-like chemotaxis protein